MKPLGVTILIFLSISCLLISSCTSLYIKKPFSISTNNFVYPKSWYGIYITEYSGKRYLLSIEDDASNEFSISILTLGDCNSDGFEIDISTGFEIDKSTLSDHEKINNRINHLSNFFKKYSPLTSKSYNIIFNDVCYGFVQRDKISVKLIENVDNNNYLFLISSSNSPIAPDQSYWLPIHMKVHDSGFDINCIVNVSNPNKFDNFVKQQSYISKYPHTISNVSKEYLYSILDSKKMKDLGWGKIVSTHKFVKIPKYSINIIFSKALALLVGLGLIACILRSNKKYRNKVESYTKIHGKDLSHTASKFDTNQVRFSFVIFFIIFTMVVFLLFFPNQEAITL